MTGFSWLGAPGRLPDDSQLRTAAWQMQHAADETAGLASTVQATADAIGPGVWVDASSSHAKTLLVSLAGELNRARSDLTQAGDALSTLASYVAGQRSRYEQLVAELDNLGRPSGPGEPIAALTRIADLNRELASIQSGVTAAMARAAGVLERSSGTAPRHGGGHSVWSTIGDVASGLWDGTYQMGKGLFKLGVEAAKLNPLRAELDPVGYLHDVEKAGEGGLKVARAFLDNPGGFAKSLGGALINADELKKDPAHWVGMIVPTIASVFLDGEGLAAKAGDLGESVDAAAGVSTAASRSAQLDSLASTYNLDRTGVEHVLDGYVDHNGFPVGFHTAPGPQDIVSTQADGTVVTDDRIIIPHPGGPNANGTYEANVFLRDPASGQWLEKQATTHTFFPDSWSDDKVMQAISSVIKNGIPGPRDTITGTYDGVDIQVVAPNGTLKTAFPLPPTP